MSGLISSFVSDTSSLHCVVFYRHPPTSASDPHGHPAHAPTPPPHPHPHQAFDRMSGFTLWYVSDTSPLHYVVFYKHPPTSAVVPQGHPAHAPTLPFSP